MNEWKNLEIDNLPPDILTGDYQFLRRNPKNDLHKTTAENTVDMLIDFVNGEAIQYRKPEPKPPSHEEIMTKWWKHGNNSDLIWHNARAYSPEDSNGEQAYWVYKDWRKKEWFIDRESADIPPE